MIFCVNISNKIIPFFIRCFFLKSDVKKKIKKVQLRYAWDDKTQKEVKVDVVKLNDTDKGGIEEINATNLEDIVLVSDHLMPIQRATGIPMHVILLGDMQKVINTQSEIISNIRVALKEEFDERLIGSDSFHLKNQMKEILTNFERDFREKLSQTNLVQNSDHTLLHSDTVGDSQKKIKNHLYLWGGFHRRVPEDWEFPLKIGLRISFYRYFFGDESTKVGPLRYLTTQDVFKMKKNRKYLNNYKALMKFMLDEAKERNCFFNNPIKAQFGIMYDASRDKVFALSNNKRAETFSWGTHAKNMHLYLSKNKKK